MLLLATLRLGSDFGEVNQPRVDFCFLACELLERTCIESCYIDLDIVCIIVYSCNMVKLYTCYLYILVNFSGLMVFCVNVRCQAVLAKLSSITPHVLGIKGCGDCKAGGLCGGREIKGNIGCESLCNLLQNQNLEFVQAGFEGSRGLSMLILQCPDLLPGFPWGSRRI